jgi:hypothetical protein
MAKRIGLWAFVGFAVGVCWTFFFAVIFDHSLSYTTQTAIDIAVRITVPLSWTGRKIRMTYSSAILFNAATYALLGLALKPLWRRKKVPETRVERRLC